MSALRVRNATDADTEFLFELFSENSQTNPAAWGLGEDQRSSLTMLQFKEEQESYRQNFPGAALMIVEWGSHRVGRLIVHEADHEIHLVDILVVGSWRGHGIGTDILSFFKHRAQSQDKPLRLRVAHQNPARRLYERHGFSVTRDDGAYFTMEWWSPAGF